MKKAPMHLKKKTRGWVNAVLRGWQLEEHHERLLLLAAEAFDRAEEAREQIARDGVTILDRFGQLRAHPAVAIERDARLAFARLVRELRLDESEPEDARMPRPGAPPALHFERQGG